MEDNDKSESAETDGPESPDRPEGPPARGATEPSDFCARLAEELAGAFSSLLRAPTRVHARGVRRCAYSEFRRSVGEPTCCFPLGGEDGRVAAWVEIPSPLAFALLARMLGGGGGEEHLPDRPLTQIERRVLGRVADLVAAGLARALPQAPGRQLRRISDQPGAGPPPDAPVAVFRLSARLLRHAGPLRVCVPCGHLPPGLLPPEDADDRGQHRPANGAATGGDFPLELSVAVDGCRIDADELAGLSRGDMLVTDADADGEVVVRVAGIPKFVGRLGAAEGKRAVKITRRLDPPSIS